MPGESHLWFGQSGTEYEHTRHNVGWWVVNDARRAWSFPEFRRAGAVRLSTGTVAGHEVVLLQPLTYMNRSGRVLAPLREQPSFEIARDLLVVVDDTALEVGRVRLRARGSAGGHNGLKSVEAALQTQEYARLRIGVGQPPADVDMVDWVLSGFAGETEERLVRELAQQLVPALETWLLDGAEAAAARCNR
jgi:PTH1 family peptidyl-tRNA hydrolase